MDPLVEKTLMDLRFEVFQNNEFQYLLDYIAADGLTPEAAALVLERVTLEWDDPAPGPGVWLRRPA